MTEFLTKSNDNYIFPRHDFSGLVLFSTSCYHLKLPMVTILTTWKSIDGSYFLFPPPDTSILTISNVPLKKNGEICSDNRSYDNHFDLPTLVGETRDQQWMYDILSKIMWSSLHS